MPGRSPSRSGGPSSNTIKRVATGNERFGTPSPACGLFEGVGCNTVQGKGCWSDPCESRAKAPRTPSQGCWSFTMTSSARG